MAVSVEDISRNVSPVEQRLQSSPAAMETLKKSLFTSSSSGCSLATMAPDEEISSSTSRLKRAMWSSGSLVSTVSWAGIPAGEDEALQFKIVIEKDVPTAREEAPVEPPAPPCPPPCPLPSPCPYPKGKVSAEMSHGFVKKEYCNLAEIKVHLLDVPEPVTSIVDTTQVVATLEIKGPTSHECSTRSHSVVEDCEALGDYEQQKKSRQVSIPSMLWACGSAFVQGLRQDYHIDSVSSGIPVGF